MLFNFASTPSNAEPMLGFIEGAKVPKLQQGGAFVFTGSNQSPDWVDFDTSKVQLVSGGSGVNAGRYVAIFRLLTTGRYVWEDQSEGDKEIEWEIEKKAVSAVPYQIGEVVYTGGVQSPTWNNYDPAVLSVSGDLSGTDAGEYSVEFMPTENALWWDGTISSKSATWTIAKATIETIPTQSGSLEYTGGILTPVWTNYDSKELTISGNISGVDAGTYTVTFTPTKNYAWADGSTEGRSVSWEIGKAENVVSIEPDSLELTADEPEQIITITQLIGSEILASSSDEDIAIVSVSGNEITVTGLSDGECIVSIQVPGNENYKEFNAKIPVSFAPSLYEAGIDWFSITLPSSADWYSVTYGDGKFVTVAYGSNTAAYSTDGINWTATTLPASVNWRAVTYGNGKFVAVAYGSNKAAYSTDGINWTAITMPSSLNWQSIVYGDDKFVALPYGYVETGAYSYDGINWTSITLPSKTAWRGIAYGNGIFVAIIYGGSYAAYSLDGINWTRTTLPLSAYWNCVTYGNGKFIIISHNGDVLHSIDGITWTKADSLEDNSWVNIVYGSGKFVAVGYYTQTAAYSIDGINWIQTTLPSTIGWYGVTYGDGKFVAVARNTSEAAYSSNKGPEI